MMVMKKHESTKNSISSYRTTPLLHGSFSLLYTLFLINVHFLRRKNVTNLLTSVVAPFEAVTGIRTPRMEL